MKRHLLAGALAGALGVAGLLAPSTTWAQGTDAGPDACPCGNGPGMGGGMGEGMMGHHGMGGGLGLGPIWRLDLTDAQRSQVNKIADDFRRANWGTMGKLADARSKLRELESAAQPNPKEIGAAYAEVGKLQQVLLEARVQAGNQAQAVLTDAQRQQLQQLRSQGWGPHGGGFRHHGRRGGAARL